MKCITVKKSGSKYITKNLKGKECLFYISTAKFFIFKYVPIYTFKTTYIYLEDTK